MSLVLKNATLITAADIFRADILIEGEQIRAIGQGLNASQALDCQGKMITPGGVDAHTHFDLPMPGTVSSDDHYTGHKAAAFGGVTTVIDFVPHPGADELSTKERGGLRVGVEAWRAKADPALGGKACIDFGFHMNITHFDEAVAQEIADLPALGITSLKVFTAYNGRLRLGDGEIFQVMRIAKEHGILTLLHAENGDVIELLIAEARRAGHCSAEWHARTRPAWGAVEATLRGAALAAQAGAPLYIVHTNAAGEVDQIQYAREHGLPVMGETCPQYLFFTEDHLRRPDGAKWVCAPPMRAAADNARLWQGLQEGTLQTIATDHCPFFFNGAQPILYEGQEIAIPGKELGREDFTKIPNGLPGVGDRLPVLWTYGVGAGRLSPQQFVALNSANPAKIFGLYPQKGALLPGSDADLVVWDPERRVTYGTAYAQHRTDYNLYEGWELVGMPEKVMLRGQWIVEDGRWLGRAGMGRFLKRRSGLVL